MKKYQKILSIALAGALVAAPIANCGAAYALTQDETIYAKLNSDGSAKNTSAVIHLSDTGDAEISSKTGLTNIENLNGFEEFDLKDTNLTWKANSKDIYYKGQATNNLPVQLKVAYKLNGETKSRDELIGKSGDIEVNYKFTNLSKVDDLYTPFVAALTTVFKEGAVSNLEVTNGKVESNGHSLAVAAVAAPGLYESLNIAELQNADNITVKFHTDKFEMNDVYIVVTPKLLDASDLKVFSEIDRLSNNMTTLSSSSRQLLGGVSALQDGLLRLKNGVVSAKEKLNSSAKAPLIDADTMNQIKTTATTKAEQGVEAKRAEITAGIKAQLVQNAEMQSMLTLQVQAKCATLNGACADPAVLQQVTEGVQNAVVSQLVESSMALVKQAARETATATAEQVANQVASTVSQTFATTVSDAFDTIIAGIDRLTSGANNLQTGMAKFDREGIQPMVNFVNGNVKAASNKVERLIELANNYQSYAGLADNAKGETKFIMMIDAKK